MNNKKIIIIGCIVFVILFIIFRGIEYGKLSELIGNEGFIVGGSKAIQDPTFIRLQYISKAIVLGFPVIIIALISKGSYFLNVGLYTIAVFAIHLAWHFMFYPEDLLGNSNKNLAEYAFSLAVILITALTMKMFIALSNRHKLGSNYNKAAQQDRQGRLC